MTTPFDNAAVSTDISALKAPVTRKHGWLPLLTVLFLISYGLMTMLIVEQGATIESQRALIRELFHDSTELSAVRMKAQQERARTQAAQTQAAPTQSPVNQNPSSQIPSTKNPSTQAPNSQAPSSQAGPQHRTQSQAGKQKPFQMPSKPASDLTDASRNLITI